MGYFVEGPAKLLNDFLSAKPWRPGWINKDAMVCTGDKELKCGVTMENTLDYHSEWMSDTASIKVSWLRMTKSFALRLNEERPLLSLMMAFSVWHCKKSVWVHRMPKGRVCSYGIIPITGRPFVWQILLSSGAHCSYGRFDIEKSIAVNFQFWHVDHWKSSWWQH